MFCMNRKVGVVFSVISIIFEVVSTLVLTPFLIKTLGQSEFGVYKMCLSIIAYVLLLDLGIGNSIIRFASKYRFNGDKQNENKLAGVSFLFYVIIAIVALIVGLIIIVAFPYIFKTGLSENEIILGKKLILLTAITSSITLMTSGFYNIIIAYERFFISKGTNIIQIVLKIALSFVALKMGFGSIGVCFVNLVLTACVRFFYIFYAVKFLHIRPTIKKCDLAFIKEIVGYSGLIAIQMVATQINQSIDQIFIGSFVSNSSSILGVYAVGAQINQYFMSIGVAITGVLMPGIVKFAERNPNSVELTKEMSRLGRLILFPLIIVYSGFVVFGRQFITVWVGHEYSEAYKVTLLLMTPQLLASVFSPCLQFLWALNKQKELSWTKFAIVLTNCLLTIVLIKWNPLIGASIGTMISVIAGDVLVLIIIVKIKTKMHVYNYLEQTFMLTTITMFASSTFVSRGINMVFQINGWTKLFIACFAFAIVSMICLYCFCFNGYEKKLINKIVFRKKRIKNG